MNLLLLILSKSLIVLFYVYDKIILFYIRLLSKFMINTCTTQNYTNIYTHSSVHKPTHISLYIYNSIHYINTYISYIIVVTLHKYIAIIFYNVNTFLEDFKDYIIYLEILRCEYILCIFLLLIIRDPWSINRNILYYCCISSSYYINLLYNLSHLHTRWYDYIFRFRDVIGYNVFYIFTSSQQIPRAVSGDLRLVDIITIYYKISYVCEFINVTSSNYYINFLICNG